MGKRDETAWCRPIVELVDLDWNEAPLCETRGCGEVAAWVIGTRDGAPRHVPPTSWLACCYHTEAFCRERQVPLPEALEEDDEDDEDDE